MTIKDRLSNFKQRYAELLQETQESNENWGDESYDKEVGDAIWEETRKTYKKAALHMATNKTQSAGFNPFTWKPDLFY